MLLKPKAPAIIPATAWDFYGNYRIGGGLPSRRRMLMMAGAGVGATVTLVDSDEDPANLTTYTFSGKTLGTGKIVVGIWQSGGNRTISSITVDGNAASLIVAEESASDGIHIYQYNGNASATGDIVVTLSGANSRCAIAVWLVTGAADAVNDTGFDNDTDTPETTVDVNAGGVVVGYVAGGDIGLRTWTWSNLNEDVDAQVEGNFSHSGASLESASSQTVTVTPDASGSISATRGILVTASWDAA